MSTPRRTALITGANGYIGNVVASAFLRAGYRTFGLIRRESARSALLEQEIIPIIGSPDDPSFIPEIIAQSPTFDVIASLTEDLFNFTPHFKNTLAMLQKLSENSAKHGVKPLVIFTAGTKDYGTTGLHGSPGLAAQNEDAPLNPPTLLKERTFTILKCFDHADVFDVMLVRPTTLYGYSSSFYGPAFEAAALAAREGNGVLRIAADPNSIMQGTHVDDVASAYIALASAPRQTVVGKCYNIAAQGYQTLEQVAAALAKEYGITSVEFAPHEGPIEGLDPVKFLWGFSQWAGSDRLRRDTGWSDVRPPFSEDVALYRRAYEEAVRKGHSDVERIKGYIQGA